MLNLIKYAFYGVIFFMLLMAFSDFMDVFGLELELSEAYKERTVVHNPIYKSIQKWQLDNPKYTIFNF